MQTHDKSIYHILTQNIIFYMSFSKSMYPSDSRKHRSTPPATRPIGFLFAMKLYWYNETTNWMKTIFYVLCFVCKPKLAIHEVYLYFVFSSSAFEIMERLAKNPFYMPESYPLPFELKRAAIEYQMTANWKKSKQDRELRAMQTKEAKIVAYTSTNVSRKTKNVNRSPRQVRRNERERGRKARLNAAFKVLRNVIPLYSEGLNKEKLTQVQVLRLAAKYIMTLSEILGSEAPGSDDDFYASQFQCSYDMLQYINQV